LVILSDRYSIQYKESLIKNIKEGKGAVIDKKKNSNSEKDNNSNKNNKNNNNSGGSDR